MKKLSLLLKSLIGNYRILKVSPAINLFLLNYMRKFKQVNIAGDLILHSHLPPLTSRAFSRFVKEHLIEKSEGPTHAQIGITNICPQKCEYCYNKYRTGRTLDKAAIIHTIQELKKMGVIWLGLTGGEPMLNKDIFEIISSASDECAVKLFTTGINLDIKAAQKLKKAGLDYISVSLDHWLEAEHDKARGVNGAYKTAINAIKTLQDQGEIHISVSAVLSKEMIMKNQIDEFLEFLIDLGVHEAWLSEAKPSVVSLCSEEKIITEDQRKKLVKLQDRYNKEGRITVNYLGHFEGKEYFGCTAGQKMIYIDAFGEVSPCVFTPMTFGNVTETPVNEIFYTMKELFSPHEDCFINKNYNLIRIYLPNTGPIQKKDSIKIAQEKGKGSLPRFFKLYYKED